RYTVVEGDTLWDISGKYLRDPWRWPEVWQGNPQVDNPDLIFPGDVLVMTFIDGKPALRSLRRETVKLSPSARPTNFRDAIPPVDPSAIQAYINAPLVTDENELMNAGYIVDGIDNHLLMGKYDQFYARGVEDQQADEYRVFRPGRHFVDPVSEESLGWEAEHVGNALMLRQGDPARLSLLDTYSDVSVRDRLRPVHKRESLPFFYPKAPDNSGLRGVILETTNKSIELGPLSVVAISLGDREGVKPGDVFRILSHSVAKKDPVSGEKYSIPEEKVGLLLVFRTFAKVSYALITNTTRAIRPNDLVVSPDLD
ncbi:MAG: LysM peptidoglycan-binding domain-containing protein, partial [Gammaproteobacteria bacterium]|nr:LysM peptidoglycan-binding domain-containing protein [Gammaproteobacteria bacterium]